MFGKIFILSVVGTVLYYVFKPETPSKVKTGVTQKTTTKNDQSKSVAETKTTESPKPETTPTESAEPKQPITYMIQAGDYPVGLAKRFTGDGNRWKEILPLNPKLKRHPKSGNVTNFHPGVVLVIPDSWGAK